MPVTDQCPVSGKPKDKGRKIDYFFLFAENEVEMKTEYFSTLISTLIITKGNAMYYCKVDHLFPPKIVLLTGMTF